MSREPEVEMHMTGSRDQSSPSIPDYWEALNATEAEVIKLYAGGHTRTEIAQKLHLSKHTVSHLLSLVKEKFHAQTLAQAAALYKTFFE